MVLSVVVTVVDGGEALREVLRSLAAQETPPPMQVVVPWDRTVESMATLAAEFPDVEFVALGDVRTTHPPASAAGQHELFDRRRAAGLAAARGEVVAMLEDRAVPRADWARTIVRLHEQPFAVIGGAIDPAVTTATGLALYFCDFGRYGRPFAGGPATWVSDVNVSYKRATLEAIRDLWAERYQEPVVHWAIAQRGGTLFLSPEIVVAHQRRPAPLRTLLAERFAWGRLFGSIRARYLSVPQRLAYAAAGPVLPFLLLLRHGRTQRSKGRLGTYVRAIPATALMLAAWTAGEVTGYLSGEA
jgi:hypothetical protein